MSGLMIVGVPLSTGDKYIPRLTMRRIFNTKCFREERYRHEIANHYRDYKMQMQQHQHHLSHTMTTRSGHRHRQRHQKRQQRHLHHLQHQRRHKHRLEATASTFSGSLASQYSQFRGVWPTHVHYFPRFGDTYAPRGRQTICSGEPPDETYNAAVRLIKQAHSCEQLKELVQRQLWIYSCQRHRLRHREHVQQSQNAIADDDNDEDDDDDNSNHNDDSNNSNNRKTCSGQRDHGGSSSNNVKRNHYKLNINKNKVENLQRQQEQQQQQQRRRIDFYTYLQLANGYYEQGLQANIKYLESIGKRNAIKTKQQQQQQQHLRDTVDSAVLPLVKLLKSWRRGKHSVGNKNSYPIAEQSLDAIRVHIRPNIQHQQQLQQQKQQQLTHYHHNQRQQQQQQQHHQNVADKLTMCDYFVKPSSNSSSSSSKSNSNLSATFDQCKFYEIIDNLSQLSLTNESNIDRLQLPLITLTDYTQQQQQQVAASHEQQQMHIPNEARPPKSLVTFRK